MPFPFWGISAGMPSDASLPLTTICAFLLVLARISGAIVFVPIPGVSASPQPVRIILALSFTMSLFPLWPVVAVMPGIGLLTGWLVAEAALGVTVGLVVSFLAEAFGVFGQMVGLQAGYSFASTIDPTTQADSSIFVVLSQSIAGLLFFALGLHREVLRLFARSLETTPPGSFVITPASTEALIQLGSTIFSTGIRLAFPVVALMIMVDIALALLGRINSQLQLGSLTFPVKMLAGLAVVSAMAAIFPSIYQAYAERLFGVLPALTGH
jgi:flagellar biosynthesis protein FliR